MSEVVNMSDVVADEWWQALSRLVGAMEPAAAGAVTPPEELNAALHELRRHGRHAVLADPKARLVARLIRVLA